MRRTVRSEFKEDISRKKDEVCRHFPKRKSANKSGWCPGLQPGSATPACSNFQMTFNLTLPKSTVTKSGVSSPGGRAPAPPVPAPVLAAAALSAAACAAAALRSSSRLLRRAVTSASACRGGGQQGSRRCVKKCDLSGALLYCLALLQ
jgi:hypothetical protein